ncbi:phosphatidylinositol binding clathrin assembly protein a isoform X2 [Pagrus major]|uniref:phosphatidylinositol binding clathrin assembly protein a isoform X2 n=1 Tax=Pagrus major TaxID=143350 RepID=UPI003CC88B69
MSGQSITDRITAAQHSVTGSAISKTVCKATTHEIMGPKKKHLDYLIQCTNEMNVNIPQLADTLFERTTNTSWVVVFKSLTTTHHLMVYGNERFIQYLASRNTLFNLSNFLDKSGLQGYDMSTFIRRYSRYLNEKAVSYRQVAFDFTKVKRGSDGVMRTMNTEKLLKTIPIIQNQMDVLLDFNVNANELTNGVINAAFMLLFKDAIRLFAAYNEGIINLLEKYFDMKKLQCKEGLDIYKKFLTRMTRISEFLKVAEQVGIDRGDIPDLSQAPSSLLDALEQHLASLEGKKVKDSTAASRASTLSNAVSSLANTGISFTKVDEREKQAALEEEQARLKALKEQRLKELQKNPAIATTDSSPVSTTGGTINSAPSIDLFSTPSSTNSNSKAANDLLDLQPAFQQPLPVSSSNTWGDSFCGPSPYNTTPLFQSEPPAVAGLFRGFTASPAPQQPQNSRGLNVDFDSVFGNNTNANNLDSTGGILKPTVASSPNQGMTPHGQQPRKLVSNDLDSSLANLVGNLAIGNGTAKNDLHWSQPGEKKLTGGTNWQPKTAPSTTWNPAAMAPSVMTFPATTPTGMMAYAMPPHMGSMMMTQPTMMYTQPVMRPANPFGPNPGAQSFFSTTNQVLSTGKDFVYFKVFKFELNLLELWNMLHHYILAFLTLRCIDHRLNVFLKDKNVKLLVILSAENNPYCVPNLTLTLFALFVPITALSCEMLSQLTPQLAALHTLQMSHLLLNKDWMWEFENYTCSFMQACVLTCL